MADDRPDADAPAPTHQPMPLVYNIPAARVEAFPNAPLIVRSTDLDTCRRALSGERLDNLLYLQLSAPAADIEPLSQWGEGIPIELVVRDPATTFARLYDCAPLIDRHPVRAAIPLVPGFGRAIKLAVSLQFAVQLQVGRPADMPLDELASILDFYLHNPTVSQPVDFFHSLLFAFHDDEPVTLWEILEDDPRAFRHIDDQGRERLPGRLAELEPERETARFLATFDPQRAATGSECADCRFFANCGGYFKWPDPNYRCASIQPVLQTVQDAATELRHDLQHHRENTSGAVS